MSEPSQESLGKTQGPEDSSNEFPQLSRQDFVLSLAFTTLLIVAASCVILLLTRVNILNHVLMLVTPLPSAPLDFVLIVFLPATMITLEWLLFRFVPRHYWFEPVNDQLAQRFNTGELALFFAVGAVSEELLFRGVLQNLFGFWIATVFFVVIHVRYLKRPVLLATILILACGLGGAYLLCGKLWVTILCHFLLNIGAILMLKKRV
ncbi:MAG: CPBP family intramembrane metalloprotease [Peptococcaceae bacterium]|nr:CPBP family intramembrane metalloprotease [Peptococcaceae bacterium]